MRSVALALACFAAALVAAPVAAAVPRSAATLPFATAARTQRAPSFESLQGVYLGAMPPGEPVSILVHLPGRRDAELDQFVASVMVPNAHVRRYLTPQEFGTYFGADPVVYARAIAALRAGGFVIDYLPANRTDIVAHAPASRVEAFFATPLDRRIENGRLFFAARYQPIVPAVLGTGVISGLETYHHHHPLSLRRPHGPVQGGWTPKDIQGVYDVAALYAKHLDGKGVTIANSTCGAAADSDLASFQSTFGLPQTPMLSTGVGGALSTSCSGYDNTESTVDVDSAMTIAPYATFHQVVAHTISDHDFNLSYEYIVDAAKTVHVVTTSWGACEQDFKGTPSLTIDDKLFKQAIAQGQFWFSASGDTGTDDCDQKRVTAVSVDYPGSSPYVVSVGGTDVQGQTGAGGAVTWTGETAWQYANSDGASGGGASILFPKPAYQRALTPKDGKRDVPDVALISDNRNDGTYIFIDGHVEGEVGGDSEAAPMWAAFLAIVEQSKGAAKLDDPHARLYALAATKDYATLFHDITSGNNGVPLGSDPDYPQRSFPGYNAGPGFDETTGLGSFDAAALLKAY